MSCTECNSARLSGQCCVLMAEHSVKVLLPPSSPSIHSELTFPHGGDFQPPALR